MKYVPYGKHWLDKKDIEEVIKVLNSDWITQGPKIKEFEEALCEYTGAKYAVAVSSGTAGLHIACLAAGIKEGDEVITSPITFVASANCILYCRAKPVFADIQEDTVNIDPKEIKKKLTKKTKAIIPVHFAGHPCDLEEIRKISKKHQLTVIEDACHALGAEYKGSKIGACKYSDMTVFSFHPVKSITTGEGGAVLTNNKRLYEKLIILRHHGIAKERRKFIKRLEGEWYYEMQMLGFNYRITDFQCALGISQLKKLNKFIRKRRKLAKIYNEKLSKLSGIILPTERPYVKSSWHIYCIKVAKTNWRRVIYERLRSMGIGVQIHYIPIYFHPFYKKHLGCGKSICPNAEKYYATTITLPLYPSLSVNSLDYVVKSLKKVMRTLQQRKESSNE